jgi:hypothetical protein
MAAGIGILSAADSTNAPAKKSIISGVSIAPVAVIAYTDLDGPPSYGAGLNLGYQLNKSVSLNATAIGFEKPDDWRGKAVDELDVTAKFDLFSASKLTLFGVAGGSRQFTTSDWGLDVGGGARFNFTVKLSAFGQYVLQVWDKGETTGQVQTGISYGF